MFAIGLGVFVVAAGAGGYYYKDNLWNLISEDKLVKILKKEYNDEDESLYTEFIQYMINSNPKSPLWVGENKEINTIKNELTEKHKLNDNNTISRNLTNCLEKILKYNELYDTLETYRKDSFNSENQKHVLELKNLWNVHGKEYGDFALLSSFWEDFGFQGKNPISDFRAGGFLSAKNLSFFATKKPKIYKDSLEKVSHGNTYVPHAVVGIHVTMFIMDLFKSGLLHRHFIYRECSEKEINLIYCFIFENLIDFYVNSNPKNVFDFNTKKDEFFAKVKKDIVIQDGVVYLDQ